MRLNRSDRLVLLFLMAIALAVWAGVLLDRWFLQPRSELVRLDEAGMDSLEAVWSNADSADLHGKASSRSYGSSQRYSSSDYYAVPALQPETFPFDPNTADSTVLLRLGLAPWQVRAIYKYRARGGRYHRPEDFQRLPGMTPELWNRLASSVRIGEAYRYYNREDLDRARSTDSATASSSASSTSASSSSSPSSSSSSSLVAVVPEASPSGSPGSLPSDSRPAKFTELTRLDLNSVDTTTLKRVPGIASYRARQIVRYRDRLGGYSSVEQLSEIENLPLELQAWFTIETGVYRKLNLNTASIGELARHPYIGSARAKAIVNYRNTQGRIRSLADFSLLPEFSADVIQRLEPYVDY